jgi:hypothetical protein
MIYTRGRVYGVENVANGKLGPAGYSEARGCLVLQSAHVLPVLISTFRGTAVKHG